MKAYLINLGIWDDAKDADLIAQLNMEIKEATEYADRAPFPKPEDTLLHVYASAEEEKSWQ
ncbi:hypothetical protein D3C76_1449560 [compost metagenome]